MDNSSRYGYIRNYVLSVLCQYHERGISIENIEAMAHEIVKAVYEGDEAWRIKEGLTLIYKVKENDN